MTVGLQTLAALVIVNLALSSLFEGTHGIVVVWFSHVSKDIQPSWEGLSLTDLAAVCHLFF